MKNIVFITVDSLRADYVFGSKAPESLETLPSLAADGIRYTNAFSNASYTKASFLSIMSGTYPWMFDSSTDGFGPDRPHVAELLSAAGYETAGFHTNTYLSPVYNYDRGFDYYFGRDRTGNVQNGAETTYNKLVERAISTAKLSDVVHKVYKSAGKHLGVQLGSNLYKPAEELNDRIVEWTERSDEPAFVWAHYMDVHNPYYPHEGTVSEGISRRKAIKLFHKATDLEGETPQEDIEILERLYRGEIAYLDQQLGDLLTRLDDTLGLEDTMIVFTSDHGEAFGEHGHVYHPGYVLYDPNIHIPIILAGPDLGAGEVTTPVSNLDVVPTMLATAGFDPDPSMVGEDISEYVETNPDSRHVFAEAWSPDDGHVMVTDGEYKLIRHLRLDEEELHRRHGESQERELNPDEHSDVYEELSGALDRHISEVSEDSGRTGDVEVTEDVRLQLKKLGYDE
jgi:arylsulfatase A-like enzyme